MAGPSSSPPSAAAPAGRAAAAAAAAADEDTAAAVGHPPRGRTRSSGLRGFMVIKNVDSRGEKFVSKRI